MDNRRLPLKLMLNALFLLIACCLLLTIFVKKDFYTNLNFARAFDYAISSSADEMLHVPISEMIRGPKSLEQDNPKLVRKVKTDYLFPPSQQGYHLSEDNDDPSMGQSSAIRTILGEKKNGFFVECGALDGETRSNTLVFEKKYGWQGVIIEGDPKNFDMVLEKRRKCWTSPACLSTKPYPMEVLFRQSFNVGKITDLGLSGTKKGHVIAQCIPIFTILLALDRPKVDYFSLDVEGNELEVLKTIPWDRVNITTLSVEFIHGKEGKQAIKDYMLDKGYQVHSEVTNKGGLANDYIFYHPKLTSL